MVLDSGRSVQGFVADNFHEKGKGFVGLWNRNIIKHSVIIYSFKLQNYIQLNNFLEQ